MSPTGSTQDYQALLEAYLRQLGLGAFLQSYQPYAANAARNSLSFERFLLGLCEAEIVHYAILHRLFKRKIVNIAQNKKKAVLLVRA